MLPRFQLFTGSFLILGFLGTMLFLLGVEPSFSPHGLRPIEGCNDAMRCDATRRRRGRGRQSLSTQSMAWVVVHCTLAFSDMARSFLNLKRTYDETGKHLCNTIVSSARRTLGHGAFEGRVCPDLLDTVHSKSPRSGAVGHRSVVTSHDCGQRILRKQRGPSAGYCRASLQTTGGWA